MIREISAAGMAALGLVGIGLVVAGVGVALIVGSISRRSPPNRD